MYESFDEGGLPSLVWWTLKAGMEPGAPSWQMLFLPLDWGCLSSSDLGVETPRFRAFGPGQG